MLKLLNKCTFLGSHLLGQLKEIETQSEGSLQPMADFTTIAGA